MLSYNGIIALTEADGPPNPFSSMRIPILKLRTQCARKNGYLCKKNKKMDSGNNKFLEIRGNEAIERRLEEHGVRPSPVRLLVMRTLDRSAEPMAVLDIERQLESVDRSSITRTMACFQDAGLVHAISDGTGAVKYELCRDEEHHHHTDEHVHFHCEKCGRTVCLTDIPVPHVDLPEGFTALRTNFVITGICDKCNNN